MPEDGPKSKDRDFSTFVPIPEKRVHVTPEERDFLLKAFAKDGSGFHILSAGAHKDILNHLNPKTLSSFSKKFEMSAGSLFIAPEAPASEATASSSEFSKINTVNLSSAVSAAVLAYALPTSASELTVYLNGMFATKNKDYTYANKTITFISEYSDVILDTSTLSVVYFTK